jgi:hypothetical protein
MNRRRCNVKGCTAFSTHRFVLLLRCVGRGDDEVSRSVGGPRVCELHATAANAKVAGVDPQARVRLDAAFAFRRLPAIDWQRTEATWERTKR